MSDLELLSPYVRTYLGQPRRQRHSAGDIGLGARDADLGRVVEVSEAVEDGAGPVLGALGAAAAEL